MKTIIFTKKALECPNGQRIFQNLKNKNFNVITQTRVSAIINQLEKKEMYHRGKDIVLFDKKRISKLQTCKPSADYQLPIVSGCIGKCVYCYLNTRFSNRPYTTIYTNIEDILAVVESYIDPTKEKTVFELSAASDPLSVSSLTDNLKKTIEFFAKSKKGFLRFVTKYANIDSLLNVEHNNKTEIRFSINTEFVVENFEHNTALVDNRLNAFKKALSSGYKVGLLLAPIIIYDGYEKDYIELINKLSTYVPKDYKDEITFELITHRYTKTAKNHILQIFPETSLDMNDNNRTFKYGQFGYGKYLYSKEEKNYLKNFLVSEIEKLPFNTKILYFI